jgi:hypothetical protein
MFAKRVFEEHPSLLEYHKRLRARYFADGTSPHFQKAFNPEDAKADAVK